MKWLVPTIAAAFVLLAPCVFAQQPAAAAPAAQSTPIDYEAVRLAKVITAIRISEGIVLDGRLDEAVWQTVSPATDFIQNQPRPGEPARFRTEVRFLYDDTNLYVGVTCFQPADTPIVLTWHATSHLEHKHGILTVYTGGAPGAKLATLTDEERTRLAVAEVEKVFPGSSDLIECTETVAWPNEPYTRASYAAFAPGEVTAHWKTLFEPAGRLFFGGEHATPIQGFMEGAVESGQRAARTILAT